MADLTEQPADFNPNKRPISPEYATVTEVHLATVNRESNIDFEKVVKVLLNNGKRLFPRVLEPWESDLLILYVIRNQAGHETKSSRVVLERYGELLERVFFGLFKIVEALY